jgi:uncharacterized protein (TIGR03086 family)
MDALGNHEQTCDGFGAVVDQVTDWDAPTPVKEWAARDVVDHLVTWLPEFVRGGAGIEMPRIDTGDPAEAWRQHRAAVRSVLEEHGDATYRSRFLGEKPLPSAIDQFYTSDVFMHTWDLARSQGIDPHLDEARCRMYLDGMSMIDDTMLRGSGQFGPAIAAPEGAAAQEQLMGFLGRDPLWAPAPTDG